MILERPTVLEGISDHPRFVAMANEVKTDLARQLDSLRRKAPAIFN